MTPEALRAFMQDAFVSSPAVRRIFQRAGLHPGDLTELGDLSRLPVTSKEDLRSLQRSEPPFGGFLAVPIGNLDHIYVSPGQVYDPEAHGDADPGLREAFVASGLGPGDIALNTLSYHLVPAGLLLDRGMRAAGATVVPGGVGNTEIQARTIVDLGVTAICASTGFFQTLADKIEETGTKLPGGWRIKRAYLGGEFGDWGAKRRSIEARYAIQTHAMYATGDVGIVGFERPGVEGYEVSPARIVQICDPASGRPVAEGESGEIVVTSLSRAYPLLRLGTGDESRALEMTPCGGAVRRLAPLSGRVGQSVKVREIFVYPSQIAELAARVPSVARLQATVSRARGRDEIRLCVELRPGATAAETQVALEQAFQAITRLRLDGCTFVAKEGLPQNAPPLVDHKDREA